MIFSKTKKWMVLGIFMLLILPLSAAQASFSLRIDLEGRIQEKIRTLLNPFDPNAQVLVTVQLKELTVELPGSGAQNAKLESSTSATTLSLDDVESIKISVISKLDPLPDSLKQVVESAVDVPAAKKHFEFKKMAADSAKLIPGVDHSVGESVDRLAAFSEMGLKRLNWFLGFFALGIALSAFAFFARRKSNFSQTEILRNIADGMKELSASGLGGAQALVSDAPAQKTFSDSVSDHRTGSPGERDWIQALGVQGLTSLLSDCYWCSEDGYAAWIWKQIRPDLAQQVFEKWALGKDYIATLSGASERVSQFHHHPYYLNPLELQNISSQDLQLWLKRNPTMWAKLSPMRQSHFDLTLMERVSFNQRTAIHLLGTEPTLPQASAVMRELRQPFSVGKLTEQDELSIFENPSSIPKDLRKQIQSLVWLALLPEDQRREILNKVQAQGLAEIWIGPKAILDRISEVLPEKKLALVLDYSQKSRPNRNSKWMNYTVEEALALLSIDVVVNEANDENDLKPNAA